MKSVLAKAKFRFVDINEIDLSDNRFDFWRINIPANESYRPDSPVWLLETGSCTVVISGRENIGAAGDNKIKSVPAFCFDRSIGQKDIWLAALSKVNRKIAPVEAFRLLRGFKEGAIYSESQIIDEVIPLLGLGKGKKVYNDIDSLGSLEEPVTRYCAEKGIGLSECVLWASMTREAQRAVLVFARGIGLQGNLLRSCLNLLDEISVRQSIAVQEILQDKVLHGIILDPDTARSAGRELFHRRLREMRYPTISLIRKEIADLSVKAGLGGEIRLDFPENLEGDTLEVSCRFSSPAQLSELAGRLNNAGKEPALKKIFNLLGKPADKES